ncbi:MAG: hypothetical protein OI74_03800 [Gammaproteobacteria bacterium (ex Lamellibrachia satsuma)]|nr:MAG: CHASE3 domain-containing protein [Gammaproteobacteria bacterium (ex Lamellibrachia satsuma)]RRS34914.1 MAG: hypothetical protein OI74_03800 [Gammaproteobacteria bacterium (ex Lamellibrachia satsuma)]RRS35424.1 MAG: hypothetical protein NV67_10515 [Gammaproteobacteria bacterium (ex Lamellibrachia satsuma)]
MTKTIANISIKYKLLTSFSLVLLVLIIQSINAIISLSSVHNQVDQVVGHTQPAVLQSMSVASELQRTTSALGFYLLSKEAQHKENYLNGLQKIDKQLNSLQELPAINGDPISVQLISDITLGIKRFDEFRDSMLVLAGNDNENIPAIQFASTNLNPMFREMLQHLSQMILSEETEESLDERKELLSKIIALRFSWTTQNNEVRLYLAFRTPAALNELLSKVVFANLNQAAAWPISVTSTPSLNFIPVITFAR